MPESDKVFAGSIPELYDTYAPDFATACERFTLYLPADLPTMGITLPSDLPQTGSTAPAP